MEVLEGLIDQDNANNSAIPDGEPSQQSEGRGILEELIEKAEAQKAAAAARQAREYKNVKDRYNFLREYGINGAAANLGARLSKQKWGRLLDELEKSVKIEFRYPDFFSNELIQAWENYEDHRRSKKAPLTPASRVLAVKKIQEAIEFGVDPVEMINRSILSGWTGLFFDKKQNASAAFLKDVLKFGR